VAQTTLLTNALLIDCTGEEPRERASVVVEGSRISEVRPGNSVPTAGHDTTVDCAGMTLMPGLTDAHVHIGPWTSTFSTSTGNIPPTSSP
jgi:imidazolonepropionase-like amidohydrolase